jgi:chloramphenicol 3-O-phosphotransferase
MIVMINGSFGVGKTTVAKHLRSILAGSKIFDPERLGLVLGSLPTWIGLRRRGTDDYQHIDLWRSSTIAGVRLLRAVAWGPVIVPMTFSDRSYFDEVVGGIKQFDPQLRVFCLRASVETIKTRLEGRRLRVEGAEAKWVARRTIECAEAHRDPHFGEPIDTENRTAGEIADEIARRLR